MWRWVSMKPGITIMFPASITSASAAEMSGAIWAILLPRISTSAFSKSPTALSIDTTQAFLMRMGRPAAVAAGGCWACAWPITLAVRAGAATATVAAVHMNCRRERPGGVQQSQFMENPVLPVCDGCDMARSPRICVVACVIRGVLLRSACMPRLALAMQAGNKSAIRGWGQAENLAGASAGHAKRQITIRRQGPVAQLDRALVS